MNKTLIIIGASGYGKVIADIAVALGGYEAIFFLDDNKSIMDCAGYPVVGRSMEYVSYIDDSDFFVAISNEAVRKTIIRQLEADKATIATLVHPSAIIGNGVEIGVGTAVMPGAVINAGTTIGKGCIIKTSASVDYDCKIGDYCLIAIDASLGSNVEVGDGSRIEANATIVDGVYVVDECLIGAGAVLVKDASVHGAYYGVPAKMSGHKGYFI